MQPFEVIAPTPQGVECGTTIEELKAEKDKGCRALTFEYAKKTKENIGENQTEWGEYKGRLQARSCSMLGIRRLKPWGKRQSHSTSMTNRAVYVPSGIRGSKKHRVRG